MPKKPPGPLAVFTNVGRGEWPIALSMSAYFFLVITTFWILKPVKKSLFIRYYDQQTFHLLGMEMNAAQSELVAKVLNMLVAYAAVVGFTILSRRLLREKLTYVLVGFFAVTLLVYAILLRDPGAATVWTFYLYGDLFSTLMVAGFFAFLSDSVTPDASKRLYGLIVLGGVIGGVFGTSTVSGFVHDLGPPEWALVCLGALALIALAAGIAGRHVIVPPDRESSERNESVEEVPSPVLAGARRVFGSRYLLSVATIVGVYEIVSTIMDFQFTSTISHYLDGPAIGAQFARVFQITNIVSMVVQIFLTGYVMSRFPLTIALLVLPLTTALWSLAFFAVPTLWIGSLMNTADNGFAYGMNQSAKEALYTVTSRREKYEAKAFIDMFVQRFAKALAVGISLGITLLFTDFSSVRWLTVATLLLGTSWVLAARYAGRHFEERDGGVPAEIRSSEQQSEA